VYENALTETYPSIEQANADKKKHPNIGAHKGGHFHKDHLVDEKNLTETSWWMKTI